MSINSDKLSVSDSLQAIEWRHGVLRLLDQRALPLETRFLELTSSAAVAQAIGDMVVRGAPAIGITAAYGAVLAAQESCAQSAGNWRQLMRPKLDKLAAARPTAVNLAWALERMRHVMDGAGEQPVKALEAEAKRIHAEDVAANRLMGEAGAALFAPAAGVVTHCNTGSLATGGYGTALGVIRSAHAHGVLAEVFMTETRPWLQGARLTAWELMHDGIPARLIADGAAAALMASGRVQWVITGADRIAANGDVVNKVGTYGLAVLARHHGVKFMVVAPTSTIDMNTQNGASIPIEQRGAEELLIFGKQRLAPDGALAWNPVFDMTPAALVDVLITERGIIEQLNTKTIRSLLDSPM